MIKSAATLRTFGHRTSATIVSKLPNIPASIIAIVAIAATVSRVRENLKKASIVYHAHDQVNFFSAETHSLNSNPFFAAV
jgi:hypothetical protein